MFGMGLAELAVIGVIAVLVFGPDRIPELAKQAGEFVRKGRKMANDARDDLRKELGPEYADLQLRDLDPRTFVKKHIIDPALRDDGETDGHDDLADDGAVNKVRRETLAVGEAPPFDDEAT